MAGESSIAELILKIVADSSDVRKELELTSNAQKKFAKDSKQSSSEASDAVDGALDKTKDKAEKTRVHMEKFGGSLRSISRSMMMMGTAMMSPFVGSLAAASKTSATVALSMNKLKWVMDDFSKSLAEAALPTVEKFIQWLLKLKKLWDDLPQKTKENIAQFALVGGGLLVVIGTVMRLIYWLKMLNLAWIAWPVAAVAAGVAAGKALEDHKEKIQLWILQMKSKISDFWDWVKRGGKEKGAVMEFPIGDKAAKNITKPEPSFYGNSTPTIELEKIVIVAKAVTGLTKAIKEMAAGFQNGLAAMLKQYGDFGKQMESFTMAFVSNMSNMFSTMFFDILMGEFKGFAEYMAEFGRTMLKMILDIIMQLIIAYWIKKALTAMGWSVLAHEGRVIDHYHIGGMIKKAHDGLQPGEVPIVAQQGEGILSRNGMASIGGTKGLEAVNQGAGVGGGLNINLVQVIRAWGPEDVYRERKMLSAAMIEELERNGAFRTAIKKYR